MPNTKADFQMVKIDFPKTWPLGSELSDLKPISRKQINSKFKQDYKDFVIWSIDKLSANLLDCPGKFYAARLHVNM